MGAKGGGGGAERERERERETGGGGGGLGGKWAELTWGYSGPHAGYNSHGEHFVLSGVGDRSNDGDCCPHPLNWNTEQRQLQPFSGLSASIRSASLSVTDML